MAITGKSSLFGSVTRTNVLLLVALLGESHRSELARILGANVSNVGKAIESLERAGVFRTKLAGRTRRVTIDPGYPYREQLVPLLERMATTHPGLMEAVSLVRRRPRRVGKEL